MSVAYEFLYGAENLEFRDKETMINFIIDHYFELMKVYRVMKTQNLATRSKKHEAHNDLQNLREREQHFDAATMSETDKIALEETKEHLSKLREEDDIHYYNGEVLEINQLSMLILNHPKLMAMLEKIDAISRVKLSKVSRVVIEKALFPARKITRAAINQTEPEQKKTMGLLKGVRSLLASIPDIIGDAILSTLEIDLDDHRPDDRRNDEEISISI